MVNGIELNRKERIKVEEGRILKCISYYGVFGFQIHCLNVGFLLLRMKIILLRAMQGNCSTYITNTGHITV